MKITIPGKNPLFNKTLIIINIFIFSVHILSAQFIPDPRARELAVDFFSEAGAKNEDVPVVFPAYQSSSPVNTEIHIYQNEKGGFVIIAENDDKYNIAGYSPAGVYIPDDVPEAFISLIQGYESWSSFPESKLTGLTKSTVIVEPLLDREGVSLNQYWHSEAGGCPTGCTATAMAQIMSYYKSPSSGTGYPCYTHPVYGTLCADIENTVFDWNNMTDSDYELLSFQVAVAMHMDFCGLYGGSTPSSPSYMNVLQDYYGYYVYNGTTDLYFLTNELDHERPVYVSLPGKVGHAVVVDGYDSDGYYHINFGWGGHYNGYFQLNTGDTFYVGPPNTGLTFGTNISAARYVSPKPLWTDPQDSLALVAIHNSLNGTTGWDLSTHAASWAGVVVMNERVTELNIGQVEGVIAPETGNLTMLRRLSISGNLNGQLPSSITSLTELREISINSYEGSLKITLPTEIGNLTRLRTLSMVYSTEGQIPASIGNLTELVFLNLSQGDLSGEIPASLGNMSGLQYLSLEGNELTGSIPASLGNLHNLHTLNLADNNMRGPLPEELGNLNQILYLTLNNNELTGQVPASLGNCPKIKILDLSHNMLEGDIPSGLGNMTDLELLDLSYNSFASLPSTTGRLKKMRGLNIEHNLLTSIPDSIVFCQSLTSFKTNNNNISYLPEGLGAWPELQEINMSYNKIDLFPENLCHLTELWTIKLNNNLITMLPAGMEMMTSVSELYLDSNLISSPVPEYYLLNDDIYMDLSYNRFTYKDVPSSGAFIRGLGKQALISFSRDTIRGKQGDTLHVDIRDISPLSHPGNAYYWLEYPDKLNAEYHSEMEDEKEGPVLNVVIDEETILKKYYCKIFNDEIPDYTWEWQGNAYTTPVLRFLNSDTLSFAILKEDEILEEKYPDNRILSSDELISGEISNNEVTLVSPFDRRGNISWQGSADGSIWQDISLSMQAQEILENIVSVSGEDLVVSPVSPAYYRCVLTEGTCDPIMSDPVRIYPMGEVLYDDMVNVADDSLSVAVDSIEIILPAGLSDDDFRLTIIKVDNPPSSPDGYRMGSVYDVSLGIGSVFETPLIVKLKNIDLEGLDLIDLPSYKPVYYDEKNEKWVQYTSGGISLNDNTIEFYTTHLTKLGWWEIARGSYTHRFTKDKVDVIYKWGTGTGEENNFLGYRYSIENFPSDPWHDSNTDPDLGGTPALIQDIAEYMNQIISRFQLLELQPADARFTVYVSNTGSGSLGHIHLGGYNLGYFTINTGLATSQEVIRQTLAHEYMHYTQSRYMNVLTSNYFWAEANAPLADRIVWDETIHENPEPETHLSESFRASEGNKSIYDLLGASWDSQTSLPVAEKVLVNPTDANVSGTLLHYMRTYREGSGLDPVKLLKDHGTTGGISTPVWRTYLNNQVAEQLGSTLGDEYAGFVQYLMSGSNSNFSILNEKGNPLSNIIANSGIENNGSFARREVYFFDKDDQTPVTKEMNISVPYLASKVLVLSNNTTDKAVVVNYKRLHEQEETQKVYYGHYDFENKIMTFHDISDSTSYSLLLDARSDKSVRECQNTSILLFVNTKCPGVLSLDNNFEASFELKAFPVINLNDIAYANVTDRMIHNYDDGSKKEFLISGLMDMSESGLFTESLLTGYTREKTMLNDSAYTVNVSFTEEFYIDNGPDLPSNKYIYVKNQVIEYNFISGNLKIIQNNNFTSIWEAYYTAITDVYHEAVTNNTLNETHEMVLKEVFSFEPQSYEMAGEVQEFVTNNTSETQSVLVRLNHSAAFTEYNAEGEVSGSGVYTYQSTDYPDNNVTITLWLHYK